MTAAAFVPRSFISKSCILPSFQHPLELVLYLIQWKSFLRMEYFRTRFYLMVIDESPLGADEMFTSYLN